MFSYILKRILTMVPVLFAVSTIVFFLIHAIPGDPVDLIIGEQALAADRVALAKDLHLDEPVSETSVIYKHALRNALNPVITIIGLQVGSLLAGAIITEKVFNWPGIGSLLLDSIGHRDYPLVEGCILVISFAFVIVNTVTDCLYKIVDPRVRL